MNVTAQKFQSLYTPVCKSLARWNHRTTLPQSRPCGRASSLREGAGEGCTTHPTARKLEGFGRFSSPLRNSETVSFYHSSDDTPSASLRSAAPSEREPGGLHHSSNRPETATLRAIFIAPTKLRIFNPSKTSGFHRGNDTGWARAPTYGNQPNA